MTDLNDLTDEQIAEIRRQLKSWFDKCRAEGPRFNLDDGTITEK